MILCHPLPSIPINGSSREFGLLWPIPHQHLQQLDPPEVRDRGWSQLATLMRGKSVPSRAHRGQQDENGNFSDPESKQGTRTGAGVWFEHVDQWASDKNDIYCSRKSLSMSRPDRSQSSYPAEHFISLILFMQ